MIKKSVKIHTRTYKIQELYLFKNEISIEYKISLYRYLSFKNYIITLNLRESPFNYMVETSSYSDHCNLNAV